MENKNLVMDKYQLTMAYGYYKNNMHNVKAVFDMFYRKNPDKGGYAISAGLDELIDYIKNFELTDSDIDYLRGMELFDNEFLEYMRKLKFTGDIYAVPDGTIVFPNEPLVTVVANLLEAQLIETKLLLLKNFASLITTKASRIVNAADGRGILEFGTRRAQGEVAAVSGAKYAYVGGAVGTACVQTGKEYGIPTVGTMAHSWVESFNTEYEAFLTYAKVFPNSCTLLVDTYDTLRSGVPNAVRVAKEFLIPNGYELKGIRLDSGDLAYLSKEARKMLDDAGLYNTKIVASNSLDEYIIRDLLAQGAKIDTFGVGENLITAKNDPVFGGVYKLVGIKDGNEIIPKIKLSDNEGKIINPGYKKVYRFYDKETGFALGDVLVLQDEIIDRNEYTLINPLDTWKRKTITNYEVRELQVPIFKDGVLVYDVPSTENVRDNVQRELNTMYPEIRRLLNPHEYYVDLSESLLDLKNNLILKCRDNTYGRKRSR